MLLCQFPLAFLQTQNRDSLFHHIAYDYTYADVDSLLRDVLSEDIFKLTASAAGGEFWEWFQVRIDVYIPPCKYHVKPLSS